MSAAAIAIEHVAAWAWRASWQGAVLAVIVAVVIKAVGRRMSPGWRFGLWGLVLVRMAVPAVVEVAWWGAQAASPTVGMKTERSTFNAQHSTSNPGITANVPRRDPPSDVERSKLNVGSSVPVLTASAEASPWNWQQARVWATWTWVAGVVVLAGRVVWASARLGRVVRRMPVVTDPRVCDALRACCAEAGVRRVPVVRLLPAGGGPALVGFWRPAILLPPEVVDGMAADPLRLILMHELAHVRRRDVLINWLGTLVAVVHWPNPAAWLVLERMRYERELACDEFVLRAGQGTADRGAYARTIVGLAEALSMGGRRGVVAAGLVGILEGRTQLQRRLQMIAQYDATTCRRWPAVAAGFGILIGAAALSGVTRAADKPVGEPGRPPAAAPGGADAPAPKPVPPGPPGAPGPRPLPPLGPGIPGMPGAGGFAPPPPVPTAPPAPKPAPAKDGRAVDDDDPANGRTAEKLQKPVKIEFQGNSFSDALDFLRDTAGVDILVQWPQLEAAGLDRNTPVTLRLREPTPVGSVLSLIFRTLPVKLNYEIDKGVVVIGAAEATATEVTRVYDVSDLVMFRGEVQPGGGVPGAPGLPPPGFAGPGPGSPMAVVIPDEVAQLTHLIQTTVQPDTWREAGGPSGSITSFKGKLVIKATEPVHKEVAQLLEMLRETPGGKKTERPK